MYCFVGTDWKSALSGLRNEFLRNGIFFIQEKVNLLHFENLLETVVGNSFSLMFIIMNSKYETIKNVKGI